MDQDLYQAIKQANLRNISLVDMPMQILRYLEIKGFIDIPQNFNDPMLNYKNFQSLKNYKTMRDLNQKDIVLTNNQSLQAT